MTLEEVQKHLTPIKLCSLVQVRRYVKALGIKPIGALRQRPAQYPQNTADQILLNLGYEGEKPKRVISLRKLQSIRSESRRQRRAA
jgi:hypothetical protein